MIRMLTNYAKKLPARLGLLIIRPFSPYLKSQSHLSIRLHKYLIL